jgi:cytochrome b
MMQSKQPVWDIWVRLGHWLLVLGIAFQQISGEDLDLIDAHATVGILLAGWVIFRLFWGFAGSHYARFSSFPIPSPRIAIKSVRKLIRKETEKTPGHSAIGGLAVYLLISLIGLTALTGMASSDDILFTGPLAPLLPGFLVDFASLTHPIFSKFLMATVLLHTAAIIWHNVVMKEPLIKGIITGLKPGFDLPIRTPHPFSIVIVLRGFVAFSLCLGGTYALLAIHFGW